MRRLVSVDNLTSPERLLGLLAAIVSVDSLLHVLLWTARGRSRAAMLFVVWRCPAVVARGDERGREGASVKSVPHASCLDALIHGWRA